MTPSRSQILLAVALVGGALVGQGGRLGLLAAGLAAVAVVGIPRGVGE